MKAIFYFFLGIACMGCTAEETFILRGTIPSEFRGNEITVVRREVNRIDTLASCKVEVGKSFELKGKAIDKLVVIPELGAGTLFYAEAGNFYVEINDRYSYIIMPEQDGVQARLANCLMDEFNAFKIYCENSERLSQLKDAEAIARGEERYLALMDKINEASWKTLKTFEGTELAVDLLYEKLRGNVRYSYVDNCLKMIGNVPSSPKMDSIMNYYNRLKATQPLGKAPAFTLPNTEGKMISLSDYSGKYVLVNFWSSTCGPCRMKMRMWQREQERFKNAGVEILSISCDRKKEDWLKAIKQDQLSWEHLLEGKEMPVSQAYGMEYLSDSYLISPEGIILGKNLSLAEIEDTVRRTKN